jgi:hypothetical protein
LPAIGDLEGGTHFLDREDTDESFRDVVLVDQAARVRFLADLVLEGKERTPGLFGELACMRFDQRGLFQGEGPEVYGEDALVLEKALHAPRIAEGEIALEDQTIKTRKHSRDLVGVFL